MFACQMLMLTGPSTPLVFIMSGLQDTMYVHCKGETVITGQSLKVLAVSGQDAVASFGTATPGKAIPGNVYQTRFRIRHCYGVFHSSRSDQ